jgi:hypothetical protein
MDSDYEEPDPDNTLGPSESLDSDDVCNDYGDVVVDAPNRITEEEIGELVNVMARVDNHWSVVSP